MDQVTFDAQDLIQWTPPPPPPTLICLQCSTDYETCDCFEYYEVTPLSKFGISHIPPYTNLWCRTCNVVGACICELFVPSQTVPLLPVHTPFKMPLTRPNKKPDRRFQYVQDCLAANLLWDFYPPKYLFC
jgi:hypothetical protein